MLRRFMPIRGGTVPNLVIAQRVLDKMETAAERFIEDETGEAMIGLIIPGDNTNGVPTMYVLDTISPDDSAVRQLHTFQQGDERQDEIIWWLQENWHVQREKRQNSYGNAQQAKWDVPLRYLGDWHKQPGYMIAPSTGDLMTALDWLDDDSNQMEALLTPIVTLGHPATIDISTTGVNYIAVPQGDGTAIRIDFWYIHRETRVFQPISPVVYPDDQLPGLTSYPWHLTNPQRARSEFGRFEDQDVYYSVVLEDTDGKLPLEVCITAARLGGSKLFLISTPWNYPASPPEIRLTPFVQMQEGQTIADVFGEWWEKAETVPKLEDWTWSEDKYLLDYLTVLEDKLGLAPQVTTEAEKPAEEVDAPQTTTQPEATGDTQATTDANAETTEEATEETTTEDSQS